MFDRVVGSVINALVGAFLGAVMNAISGPVISIMRAGQFASEPSAQRIITFLDAAFGNFLRAVLLGALVILLAGAVVESQVIAG
jgi:hypothetical protein